MVIPDRFLATVGHSWKHCVASQLILVIAIVAIQGCARRPASQDEDSNSKLSGASVATPNARGARNYPDLPDSKSQEALSTLSLSQADNSVLGIRRNQFLPESVLSGMLEQRSPVSVPFQAKRHIVIQLHPRTTKAEVLSLLADFQLEPIHAIPELGVLTVQTRYDATAPAVIAATNVEEIEKMAISRVTERLRTDRRVLVAVPNTVLSTSVLRAAVEPTIEERAAEAKKETPDWGIGDISAGFVWPRLPRNQVIGIIDVGFAKHTDLQLKRGLGASQEAFLEDSEGSQEEKNHGTHVAGIICARHNGTGVQGVLNDCTVVYSTVRRLLSGNNQVDMESALGWSAFFSEYIATVLDFIRANPDVKVINLSLGYNWETKFSIDPRTDRVLVDIIRGQGRIYMSLLEYAASHDVSLVSAAGNDSSSLAPPLEAQWASPFNFGAKLMMETDKWSNGLIVEAHDRQGRRPRFSNIGGDVSCPGVRVNSTIATPSNGYGLLSGTSMASPYCAGALAAIRLAIPSLSLETAMRCIRKSEKSNGSVPRVDIKSAMQNCLSPEPADPISARLRAIQRSSDALTQSYGSIGANAATRRCVRDLRRRFPVTAIADLGDGQGPEFSDKASRSAIQSFIAELREDGCIEPVYIAMRLGFGEDARDRHDFALAILSVFYTENYSGRVSILEVPDLGVLNDITPTQNEVIVLVGERDLAARLSAVN